MSLYQFFASDKEMPEVDNMKALPIIINGEIAAIKFANKFDKEVER